MVSGHDYLLEILQRENKSISDLVDLFGITPQAISGWKSAIPPKRVRQLCEYFSLSSKDVDLLLGNEPLHFEFRTRRGTEFDESEVSERVKVRTEVLFDRFFGNTHEEFSFDLERITERLKKCSDDFLQIAKCIRNEFEVPSYSPMTNDILNLIFERIGVVAFYLPFRAIKLVQEGQSEQTAVLFKKDGKYSILVDSDRSIDEAHFDKLHELLHILFGSFQKTDSGLEKLIDKVCGELIYPKSYIIEKYFDGESTSRPVTNKGKIWNTFFETNRNLRLIQSPRGLALAMRDCGLTTANTELFKFVGTEMHEEHRAKTTNYSAMGGMNFDFSDREALLAFFEKIEKDSGIFAYPLFEKLKKDLFIGELSAADFADTFGLKLADAIVIAALLENDGHEHIK